MLFTNFIPRIPAEKKIKLTLTFLSNSVPFPIHDTQVVAPWQTVTSCANAKESLYYFPSPKALVLSNILTGFSFLLCNFFFFKYTVHLLDIYLVYKTIPIAPSPSLALPANHPFNANYNSLCCASYSHCNLLLYDIL